jgi:hypothetical protein
LRSASSASACARIPSSLASWLPLATPGELADGERLRAAHRGASRARAPPRRRGCASRCSLANERRTVGPPQAGASSRKVGSAPTDMIY